MAFLAEIVSWCHKIIESNLPLEDVYSRDSQEGQKAHLLICALKHWSILYSYQKGVSLFLGMFFRTNQAIFSRPRRRVREREEITSRLSIQIYVPNLPTVKIWSVSKWKWLPGSSPSTHLSVLRELSHVCLGAWVLKLPLCLALEL